MRLARLLLCFPLLLIALAANAQQYDFKLSQMHGLFNLGYSSGVPIMEVYGWVKYRGNDTSASFYIPATDVPSAPNHTQELIISFADVRYSGKLYRQITSLTYATNDPKYYSAFIQDPAFLGYKMTTDEASEDGTTVATYVMRCSGS